MMSERERTAYAFGFLFGSISASLVIAAAFIIFA